MYLVILSLGANVENWPEKISNYSFMAKEKDMVN